MWTHFPIYASVSMSYQMLCCYYEQLHAMMYVSCETSMKGGVSSLSSARMSQSHWCAAHKIFFVQKLHSQPHVAVLQVKRVNEAGRRENQRSFANA
jgi:hypothetical protein